MVNSISELYSFMDGADATLTLKVLGEVDEAEEGATSTAANAGAEEGGDGERCDVTLLYGYMTFMSNVGRHQA